MASSLLQDLDARELIADSSEGLSDYLATGSRTLYVGFDPTADSLHVGNLLGLLLLRRVQLAGHRPIVLVGGGTGLIGDPSGKTRERVLNETDTVQAWSERLKQQVSRFVDFDRGENAAILVDNYEWLSGLLLIPFLRDVGKHFSIGAMLAKESVRSRLAAGISYTEFSYQLLQAYDFRELFRRHGCSVQMGGSDQWGNITVGIDLIRRMDGAAAHGLTHPLVTRADGGKLGKTESGTVWLDPDKTSAYQMYQFWLNITDADVVRFLRYFTFLPAAEIAALARQTAEAPEKREAQKVLAAEVTRLVHGTEGLKEAQRQTEEFFGQKTEGRSEPLAEGVDETEAGLYGGGARQGKVIQTSEPRSLWSVMKEIGAVPSASEARRLISQGGVAVNRHRISDINYVLRPGQAYVIQVGKRRFWRVILTGEA